MSDYITKESIMKFQAQLTKEERCAGTIEKYLRDVHKLAAWLKGTAITKDKVADWKAHLQEEKYKPVTINSMLVAVNGYLKFIGKTDCRVKLLRIQKKSFCNHEKELTRAEYGRLFDAAQEQGKLRLALLLETICATGIRVSEVRYVTVEAARKGRTEISLKGKIRTILLPNKLCRKLLKYAKKQKIASGEIFLTRSGKGMSRKQIWAEMKGLCQLAGVEKTKVFPHNLRHLFATTFYHACKDIAKLADVLGHSCVETTRIYLITTGTEHEKLMNRLELVS